MNLLPFWLQVAFVVALCAVVAWSLVEAVWVRDHAVRVVVALHVLVGVGMVDMFAPWVGDTGRARFWQISFALATVVALLGLLAASARRRELVGLWRLTALDCAAMCYMFLLFERGWSPLTYALVGVYALLTVAWVHGTLDLTHRPMCGGLPATLRPTQITRTMQATMAASMAWMFLVMAPQSGGFFARAFTVGLTEDTWWALALIGLLVRALADPATVRRLTTSAPKGRRA